ncbi:helix-turn-helix transcriptional regulator (plasmid) [Rhizobium sp. CB3060]|uniref:helix-turn-helix domain-containing protein n=1 Tax=Rhizobium sp. CB3060 TaxID=3138255 RepID=UPI0021A76252|nr:helix-turn-helix transcriptional regulator [Rhizobium tropici]UWU26192.1 helix-turn-helix transcriptional regulator [Rhizobium tropici]
MSRIVDNVPPLGDPDTSLGSVKAGRDLIAARYWEYPHHTHIRSQLVYTARGIVNCEVENFMGVIPANCAVWIPGGVSHSLRGWGAAECYFLYIDPRCIPQRMKEYRTLFVSPLLRELIIEASKQPEAYDEDGPAGRLMATLLDQLAAAPSENLHLPMPSDTRLRRMAERFMENPGDKATLEEWSARIGMSGRNLNRLLIADTGMSLGRWRRQLHMVYALRRLIAGDLVQDVALDLGYDNASGFITMFRKITGKPPARYLAEAHPFNE